MNSILLVKAKGTKRVTDIKDSLACAGSIISAAALTALGGAHTALSTLIWFIVLDYVTAVIVCQYRGQPWDWSKSIRGMWKKLLYFVIIIFAVQFERLLSCYAVGLEVDGKIRLAFLVILNAHEISSVLKNIGLCGITIPQWIKQVVDNMKSGKPGEGDSK